MVIPAKHKGIRPALYFEEGYSSEMSAQSHHERPKDYEHEYGASSTFGQRVLPPVCTAQLSEAFGTEATKSW